MSKHDLSLYSTRTIYRNTALAVAGWTLAVSLSLGWNIARQKEKTLEMAKIEAFANINKDFAFRQWATGHGGVYVEPTELTPPNRYLTHIQNRDVVTTDGMKLTLMNPAYMVRQMQETYNALYGVKGRITSLKPLNPGNAPDLWEAQVLKSFEQGVREVTEISAIGGKPYLRAMRPFVTEKGCLKCHVHQGYQVGDIRGGVGAAVPLEPYLVSENAIIQTMSFTHGGIWLIGAIGIGFVSRRATRRAEERSRENTALRDSEEQVRLLLESTGEGIYGIDLKGRCTFCNQAALRMLGYDSFDDIRGRHMHTLIHHTRADGAPLPVEECRISESICNGGGGRFEEETFWRADGSSFHAAVSAFPMRRDDQPIGAVIGFHDITERRQIAEQLAKQAAELDRSNKELEQFAYVTSHDLQEPLRMVSSYVQLLARRYQGKLDQDADEFIGFAVDGANRMQRLINDLLSYSRVGTRGNPLEPTDSDRALKDALDNLQIAIAENGATITRDSLPTVLADAPQLTQLFQNLVGNAIKFHGAQKPEIHIGAKQENGYWRFWVRDNGIGIPREDFERIFVIFQRLHTRDAYPGTGIGLAICKRIVERHGGTLWVESEPGQGTTFWFTIPAIPTQPSDGRSA